MLLDFEKVMEKAGESSDTSFLSRLQPPPGFSFVSGFPSPPKPDKYFPPIKRPLEDEDGWWRQENPVPEVRDLPHLRLCYALGAVVKPYLIAAFGIGYGHHLFSYAMGAREAGVPFATINGYDEEVGRPGSIEWVRQACLTERVPYNLGNSCADHYAEAGVPLSYIDIFHISAHRTGIDLPRDLRLANKTLSATKGVIVVERIAGFDHSAEINEFALDQGYDVYELGYAYVVARR